MVVRLLRFVGVLTVLLDPHAPLPSGCRLILIGTPEAEERFLKLYRD